MSIKKLYISIILIQNYPISYDAIYRPGPRLIDRIEKLHRLFKINSKGSDSAKENRDS